MQNRDMNYLIPQNDFISDEPVPRKTLLKFKDLAYTAEEVKQTVGSLLVMTLPELYQMYNSLNITVLEKALACAVLQGIGDGDISVLDTLLSRAFGKSRQAPEIARKVKLDTIKSHIDPLSAAAIYKELMG